MMPARLSSATSARSRSPSRTGGSVHWRSRQHLFARDYAGRRSKPRYRPGRQAAHRPGQQRGALSPGRARSSYEAYGAERAQHDQDSGGSAWLARSPTGAKPVLWGRRYRRLRPPEPAEQPRKQKHDDHRRYNVPDAPVDPVPRIMPSVALLCCPGMQRLPAPPPYTRLGHAQQGLREDSRLRLPPRLRRAVRDRVQDFLIISRFRRTTVSSGSTSRVRSYSVSSARNDPGCGAVPSAQAHVPCRSRFMRRWVCGPVEANAPPSIAR